MVKIKILRIIFLFSILLAAMTSAAFGAVVVGERVTFDLTFPRPREEVTPVVHFRVEGGPVNLSIGYSVSFPPPGPTGIGSPNTGTFNTGTHTFRLSRFTIPDPAPHEMCFSIYVRLAGGAGAPQPLISGACLRRDIRVASTGRGDRRVLPDLPSGTLPDLVVVRPHLRTSHGHTLSTLDRGTASGRADVYFGIANLGGTVAEGVEWKVVINFERCVYWDYNPGGLDRGGIPNIAARRVGSIPRIAPGQSVFVEVKFHEPVMTYIDSSQEQRWVPCEIRGVKIELDPSNRIREGNEGNTFIFPGSWTPIFE